MNVEILTNAACALSEGPLWHPEQGRLYWVDIERGNLHRFDPVTGTHERVWEGPRIGGVTLQEGGGFLLFLDRGEIRFWNDGEETVLYAGLPGEEGSRFNDVAADPQGRVFCGTMGTRERKGKLYRLDLDGSIHVALEDRGTPNGIGYSPDRKTMYFIDSEDRKLYTFRYDEATGELTGRRDLYVYPGDGVPDGMTVDANGDLWIAIYGAGLVVHLNPKGEELSRVEIPARKTTSVAFGGPSLTDLYVTSAGGDEKDAHGDGSGELMRVDAGVRGMPENRSRVRVPKN